jgi:hypothetical protein
LLNEELADFLIEKQFASFVGMLPQFITATLGRETQEFGFAEFAFFIANFAFQEIVIALDSLHDRQDADLEAGLIF